MAGNSNSGRRPKPIALRILEGSNKRPIPQTPMPTPVAPTCPDWLTALAKTEWARVVPELDAIGLLTQCDMAVLAGYCQSYARWQQAEMVIETEGMTYEALVVHPDDKAHKGGDQPEVLSTTWKPRPEVAIARAEKQAMLRYMTELGLTPSSRARIVLKGERVDEDGSLLDAQ